eukprot:TRINITY_DN104674_c0_g1_i1.p1 TRINITY_DN104674_c0_g1~~TRINITY_DN104674_c0_g1_i1.p1  ORF type:complete len:339 (+),score=71.16 TRINITY_DN104674_c0_g1_i1:39-1019(+)
MPGSHEHMICLLGCPYDPRSWSDAFLAAASAAGMPGQWLSLGRDAELASKVVARLQVWHNCGRLQNGLSAARSDSDDEARSCWPSRSDGRGGPQPPLHLVLPAALSSDNLREGTLQGSKMAVLAAIAGLVVAALCKPGGSCRRTKLTLLLSDGKQVTFDKSFIAGLQALGRAPTCFYILEHMQGLTAQQPLQLPYRFPLILDLRRRSCSSSATAATWRPLSGEVAAAAERGASRVRGSAVVVLLPPALLTSAAEAAQEEASRSCSQQDDLSSFCMQRRGHPGDSHVCLEARLMGAENAFAAVSILQSAILGGAGTASVLDAILEPM